MWRKTRVFFRENMGGVFLLTASTSLEKIRVVLRLKIRRCQSLLEVCDMKTVLWENRRVSCLEKCVEFWLFESTKKSTSSSMRITSEGSNSHSSMVSFTVPKCVEQQRFRPQPLRTKTDGRHEHIAQPSRMTKKPTRSSFLAPTIGKWNNRHLKHKELTCLGQGDKAKIIDNVILCPM